MIVLKTKCFQNFDKKEGEKEEQCIKDYMLKTK